MGTIERQIVSEKDLTIYIAIGDITSEEIADAISKFYEKGPVTQNILWDLSQAELAYFGPENIELISRTLLRFRSMREGGKTAIVAPDDLAYGLSRMYQTKTNIGDLSFDIQVFRDVGLAHAWLGEK